MSSRVRSVDVALPLLVAAILIGSPGRTGVHHVAVPVRGTLAEPCTGEALVFGGTADVIVRSTAGGDGAYALEVRADLGGATATGTSGQPYELVGAVLGRGEAGAPFPVTSEVAATGQIAGTGGSEPVAARIRFQVTVDEGGEVAPTGAAEVLTLACPEVR